MSILSAKLPTATACTLQPTIEAWKSTLKSDLHKINNAADRGEFTADEVFTSLSTLIIETMEAVECRRDAVDRQIARDILQVDGFLLCTTERHFQKQGNPPGMTTVRLPGLADHLTRLSK